MTGTTITSNSSGGYYLTAGVANPVTAASGVTISNTNNPAIGTLLSTYWTVANYGTLQASGQNGFSDGVRLLDGAVTNMAAGSIGGYYAGVSVTGSGTVVNAGTIATSNTVGSGFTYGAAFTATTAGVLLGGGGVSNAASGLISSYLEGVAVGGGGSVVNAGTISGASTASGFGVVLTAGGSFTNVSSGDVYGGEDAVLVWADAGTVSNDGVIFARNNVGVYLNGGGAVTNTSSGIVSGYRDAVYATGTAAASITNAGTLYGFNNAGAWLNSGGSVNNTGYISGYNYGVEITNVAGSVDNGGYIASSVTFATADTAFLSAGVQLADGGTVTNEAGGTIVSKWMGVQIGQAGYAFGGTVINQGTILAVDSLGDGAGVWIHGPGSIINQAGGVISGGAFGIVCYDQTTVVNAGTVYGSEYAFSAASGFADRIIELPGGVFSGVVNGGNTMGSAVYSSLELGSGSASGTITNIGTFTGFGQITLDAGATWSVGGTFASGENLGFGGADASLILTSPSGAAGATIGGFAATDTIVLSGITDVTGLTPGAGDTEMIAESAGPGLTLQFDAPLDLGYQVVDGSTAIFVPCFLPGTHILTDRGEALVEKLQVGDSIVTLSGGTRRLCWIGQGRALAVRGRRSAATPVIVRKGALAENLPHLDLHITKGHSLYFDGVLIPVEFLVNHRSILWDDRAQEVTVFHLELDAHDVLLANGVPAESYRDDGNRWLFQNANAGWGQPPKEPCAPVLTGGPVVDAVWQRLLDRTGPRRVLPLTDDPDLHLLVDGARVDPHTVDGLAHVFRLGRTPGRVVVASREAVPAELGLARDFRSLGVAVRRVAIRQGSKFVVVTADDVRLAQGFYAYEAAGNLRWTDGSATLPAAAFEGFRGEVEVVLQLAATTRYPGFGGGAGRVAA